MSHIKVFFIFAIFSFIYASKFIAASYAGTDGCKPCSISVRCSDEKKLVWATDGNSCFVFRNTCFFNNENCNRLNNNIEVLKTETQEECQKKCRPFCTLEYRPVCAIYNNEKKTFSNNCFLSSHICTTGETYSFYSEGEC